ncbi:uncharacterized protein LOC107857980 [Capsicum annuum]|uniref:uncharacterized protein LOC107857980 n=1 Tax=Capsicum annuum TaxID=4072 RepID=UPI001FB13403|nr:uncharacterized protein LOC107857980 [Capsicum annuum]
MTTTSQLMGDTKISFTEDVGARFEALDWHVIWLKNGNTGYDEIRFVLPLRKQRQSQTNPLRSRLINYILKFQDSTALFKGRKRTMGAVKLQLPLPKNVDGVTMDPNPDCTFDALLVELSSIEKKLNASSKFTKIESFQLSASKDNSQRAFVLDYGSWKWLNRYKLKSLQVRVLDVKQRNKVEEHIAEGHVFEVVRSYEMNREILHNTEENLKLIMLEKKVDSIARGIIVSSVVDDLIHECEEFPTANAIWAHLRGTYGGTSVTFLRQPTIKFDTYKKCHHQNIKQHLRVNLTHNDCIKTFFDVARHVELEDERLGAVKAASNAFMAKSSVSDDDVEDIDRDTKNEVGDHFLMGGNRVTILRLRKKAFRVGVQIQVIAVGVDVVPTFQCWFRAGVTENAQKLEEKRLTIYNEIAEQNETLGLGSNKAYRKFEMEIARRIKTITGSKESVRVKTVELIKLISDSTCPQSISIAMNFNSAVYAYGRVIVHVTSKVPLAMDILIAELNKVCIFTVPKYIVYSEAAFQSKEAYYKAIGYA